MGLDLDRTGRISVGDTRWREDVPQLSNFIIMAGAKSEVRLAWKKCLEILICSLRQVLRQGPFCVRPRC